ALVARSADHGERRHRFAVLKFHEMLLAVAPNAQAQPSGQRIDNGNADAMQPAGNLVRILIELSAGMKLGHDDLGGRHAFALVDVGRDSAPIDTHAPATLPFPY